MYPLLLIRSSGFIVAIIIGIILSYFWLYRIRRLVENYLKTLCEIVECNYKKTHRLFPIYSKKEIESAYKNRQLIAGIKYAGLGIEWAPVPFIKIKLREVIRYNYHRLPDFTYIERGWLVLRIKERLSWGLLDKNFERFFTKDFIVITLTRLLAVAEDVERGKTLEEIFK